MEWEGEHRRAARGGEKCDRWRHMEMGGKAASAHRAVCAIDELGAHEGGL